MDQIRTGFHGLEFIGTQALIKALHGDAAGLQEMIAAMGPHEQRLLARACDRLKDELWYTIRKEEKEQDNG